MTKDEALRLALEALEDTVNGCICRNCINQVETITAIKAALEAKDEPVSVKRMMGWVEGLKRQSDNGKYLHIPSGLNSGMCWELANELEQFINTTPPQRKPLTDEEIERIWESLPFCNGAWETFARAIEAAHGIKGEA